MGVTIDYTEVIPKETQDLIKHLYSSGKSWREITNQSKVSRPIATKLLQQLGAYIYKRQRIRDNYIKLEELAKKPYSTNEMDYGTFGKGKYKWEELDPRERQLAKHKDHDKLKKL